MHFITVYCTTCLIATLATPTFAQENTQIKINYVEKYTVKFPITPIVGECTKQVVFTIRGGKVFYELLYSKCKNSGGSNQVGQGYVMPLNGKSSETVHCRQSKGSKINKCDNGTSHKGSRGTLESSDTTIYNYETKLSKRSFSVSYKSNSSGKYLSRENNKWHSYSDHINGQTFKIGFTGNKCKLKLLKTKTAIEGSSYKLLKGSCTIVRK